MNRIPTDDEINAAAVELGVAVDGKCPRSKRNLVAKAITIAEDERRSTEPDVSFTHFTIDQVIAAYQRMRGADIGPSEAATMTAALAPSIYRTAPRRNRAPAYARN